MRCEKIVHIPESVIQGCCPTQRSNVCACASVGVAKRWQNGGASLWAEVVSLKSVWKVLSFPFTFSCFLLQISTNVSILFRKFCVTPVVSNVFLQNIGREIGARLAQKYPFGHAQTFDRCIVLSQGRVR